MYNPFRESCVQRCSVSFPLVPKRSSTNRLMFFCLGCSCSCDSSCGIQCFFQMQPPFLIGHLIQCRRLWYRSAVRPHIVPSVLELAHLTASNTVHSSIDQLVWESYHKCVHSALSRMFRQRRGAFIPYAGFFNLAAIYGG